MVGIDCINAGEGQGRGRERDRREESRDRWDGRGLASRGRVDRFVTDVVVFGALG
jgi:hypothetical protein